MPDEVASSIYVGQQFGNYCLTKLIGTGGFAEVYLGEHVYLKTQAAIKLLHARLADEDRESFYAEARTVAALQHEHIVDVLEFGLHKNEMSYLVMEYAPNGTLRQRFRRGTPIPLAQLLPSLKQVAAALQYAHDEHLIHRDIKPENMLLGSHNEVLLSDFGIALIAKGGHDQDTREVAGTVAYMAPEQLLGKPTIASDQYALGVVVYEWLTGERLFTGSFTEVATQHLLTPPAPLQNRVPGISPEVEHVVLTTLAKNPEQRFPSVRNFVEALENALGGTIPNADGTPPSVTMMEPVAATTLSTSRNYSTVLMMRTWLGTPLFKFVLLGLVVLVIAGSLGYAWWTQGPGSHQQMMQNLYTEATAGLPHIDDPLLKESALIWIAASNGTCQFKSGALHAVVAPLPTCASLFLNLNDFAYQAEMTIDRGTAGGLVFRNEPLPHPDGGTYSFVVTTQGTFSLEYRSLTYLDGKMSGSNIKELIKLQKSNAIKTGLHQTNLLSVLARGRFISLYINKQFVGSIQDAPWLSGTVGVFGKDDQAVDVAFRNLKIWTL